MEIESQSCYFEQRLIYIYMYISLYIHIYIHRNKRGDRVAVVLLRTEGGFHRSVACETFIVACETFIVACETFIVACETFIVACETFIVGSLLGP